MFKGTWPVESNPPQTIIRLDTHTAVCESRGDGVFWPTFVAVQLFAEGSYRPPVLSRMRPLPVPPQTIISLPVQTAVWSPRAAGTFVPVLVAVHESLTGL